MLKEGSLLRTAEDIVILVKINVFWRCVSLSTGKLVGIESPQQEMTVKDMTLLSEGETKIIKRSLLSGNILEGTIVDVNKSGYSLKIFHIESGGSNYHIVAENLTQVEKVLAHVKIFKATVVGTPFFPSYIKILKK